METQAQQCQERHLSVVNFFFRSDPSRNNDRALVATLLYQIFELHLYTKESIAEVIGSNPLIFKGCVKAQIAHPISNPPRTAFPDPHRPFFMLVNGIDECGFENSRSHADIVHALYSLATMEDSPFIVMVASRAKPYLLAKFSELPAPVVKIVLNDKYRPSKNIQVFVNSFQHITSVER